MSVSSATTGQTDFSDTMSRVNVTAEPISGYDTPNQRMRISEKTLSTPSTQLVPHWRENHPGLATPAKDAAMVPPSAVNLNNATLISEIITPVSLNQYI